MKFETCNDMVSFGSIQLFVDHSALSYALGRNLSTSIEIDLPSAISLPDNGKSMPIFQAISDSNP